MDKHLTNYIDLLGRVVKDRVTHFEGTATSLTFDLYGCIQVALQPKIDKDAKLPDGRWLDVGRLTHDDERTMPIPNFGPDAPPITALGRWGQDQVSGFEGTVSSIQFHLSGRAELALSPRVDKEGKFPDGKWFDSKRVTLVGDQRAMEAPKFEPVPVPIIPENPQAHAHGPAEKPEIACIKHDTAPRI